MRSYKDLTIIIWSLTTCTILLTAGRFYIRHRSFHRFLADDYMHAIALTWLIIFASIAQASFAPAELVMAATEQTPPSPTDLARFSRLQTPMAVAFMMSHWSIKFSFLFFYKQLFWVSLRFMRAWWVVTAMTCVTLFVPIAASLTKCGSPKDINNSVACGKHERYQQIEVLYILAVNVATDLAIMILPLAMLPKLRIRCLHKIGIALIFCVGLITVGLEILRVYMTIPGGVYDNVILYGILEASFSVIASCVPTYRSLLGSSKRHTREQSQFHWRRFKRGQTDPIAGDAEALTIRHEHKNWQPIGELRHISTECVDLQITPVESTTGIKR